MVVILNKCVLLIVSKSGLCFKQLCLKIGKKNLVLTGPQGGLGLEQKVNSNRAPTQEIKI